MQRSKFPGKPGGRYHSAKDKIKTGHHVLKIGQTEAGTSGLLEARNIQTGYKSFAEFCGESEEVNFGRIVLT